MRRCLPPLIALSCLPSIAVAQSGTDAPAAPGVFREVVDCRTIADDAARLACYDRTVAALSDARDRKELFVADKAEVRETKKGLFGLSLPQIKIFGDSAESEDVNEITTTVAAVTTDARGLYIITMADGARWKQVENRSMREPRKGDAVRIRRAAMGSYLANIKNESAVRVQRLAN